MADDEPEVPFVSVIIPSHNQAPFVSEAVDSALSQEGIDTEVLVIDDGSSDDTQEILARYGDRVRVFRNERPTERGAARNLGVANSKGEVVAFLDADDRWLRRKLALQVPHIMKGRACVGAGETIDEHGEVVGRSRPPKELERSALLMGNPDTGAGSTLVVDKDVFQELGGFPEELAVQGSEDWLLLVKLAAAGVGIAVVSEPVFQYRRHGGQSTASASRYASNMWAAVEWLEQNGYVEGGDVKKMRARRAGTIAAGFAFERDWAAARHWLRRAVRERSPGESGRALAKTGRATASSVLRRGAR